MCGFWKGIIAFFRRDTGNKDERRNLMGGQDKIESSRMERFPVNRKPTTEEQPVVHEVEVMVHRNPNELVIKEFRLIPEQRSLSINNQIDPYCRTAVEFSENESESDDLITQYDYQSSEASEFDSTMDEESEAVMRRLRIKSMTLSLPILNQIHTYEKQYQPDDNNVNTVDQQELYKKPCRTPIISITPDEETERVLKEFHIAPVVYSLPLHTQLVDYYENSSESPEIQVGSDDDSEHILTFEPDDLGLYDGQEEDDTIL